MPAHVSEFISLYKFPMGRSVFALTQVADRAGVLGRTDVQSMARQCLDEARASMALGLRFAAGRDSAYPPEVQEVDGRVDRCVGGLDKYLDSQVRVYPGEGRARSAELLARALLPGGVGAVTQISYPEQHAQVETLLARAAEPDLAPHILALPEMSDMLARLRRFNDEYGALLAALDDAPTRAEYDQARARCQEMVTGVFALIVGLYTQTPDKSERDHLLEPILEQNRAIGVARRRRRAVPDVDPETGEETPITDAQADDAPEPTETGPQAADPESAIGS